MNFPPNLTLENERVKLRPLLASDYEHLLPYSLNEPELWTYSLVPAAGEENLKVYIENALADKENGTGFPFIVWDKLNGEYAGTTRFYDYQPNHLTTQLGYTWYGKKFQRTGLNRHCKLLMLDYAFGELNLERVEFRADAQNQRSIAAMKAIGCMEEGILRSNCKSVTGRRDSIVLSILKSDPIAIGWDDGLKEALQKKCL